MARTRPMCKVGEKYALWCECGSPPTPPDGYGDVVIQYLSGPQKGKLMLMHPGCAKAMRHRVRGIGDGE